MDMKKQMSEVKALASNRSSIVTKIELLQHAGQEIHWYQASEKDGISLNDARTMKARLLQKAVPKMVTELKAELVDWQSPFLFDGMDATKILENVQRATGMKKDAAGTSVAKSVEKVVEKDKAGTSAAKSVEKVVEKDKAGTSVAKSVDEDMEVDADRALIPMSLQFGPKAPRSSNRRVPKQLPPPPTPPGSSSDESMLSGSSEKTDPDDSDYDPGQDI